MQVQVQGLPSGCRGHVRWCWLSPQVQCAFWGSPLTTGLPSMDYFLAGEAFLAERPGPHGPRPAPPEQFSEQVVRLSGLAAYLFAARAPPGLVAAPCLQQPPDPVACAAARASLFAALGLGLGLGGRGVVEGTMVGTRGGPGDLQVLFCPQTLPKVHPAFDALMSEVLGRHPRAVLVLLEVGGGVGCGFVSMPVSRCVRPPIQFRLLLHTWLHMPRLFPPPYPPHSYQPPWFICVPAPSET